MSPRDAVRARDAGAGPVHVIGRLGLELVGPLGSRGFRLDPDPALIDPHGQVGFGALALAAEAGGAIFAVRHRPGAAFVHVAMSLHRLADATGVVTSQGRVLRSSDHNLVIEIDLVDEDGRPTASSVQRIAFAETQPALATAVNEIRAQSEAFFDGRCRLRQSLVDELGIAGRDGVWTVAEAPGQALGRAGLHSGVVIAAVESAAAGSISARWQRPVRSIAASVHYLRPALDGPFLARPEILDDDGPVAVVRVPVVDAASVLVAVAEVDVIGV